MSGLGHLEEGGDHHGGRGSRGEGGTADNPKLPPKIAVMEPVLRFLQLLCENHNLSLQVSLIPSHCLYHFPSVAKLHNFR